MNNDKILCVQVQIPDTGAWRYMKKNSQGQFVCGIYSISALDAAHLDECKKAYPTLNFRLILA